MKLLEGELRLVDCDYLSSSNEVQVISVGESSQVAPPCCKWWPMIVVIFEESLSASLDTGHANIDSLKRSGVMLHLYREEWESDTRA